MFERYTEKARRVVFFARYEASRFGSPYIETEHVLLGLFREDKGLTYHLLPPHAVESIRTHIEASATPREPIPTSADLPLSHESKRVLAYGAEEAERLKHRHIDTVHLLLGLLREEKSFAAQLLRDHGVTLVSVRNEAQQSGTPPHRWRTPFAVALDQWCAERESRGGILAIKQQRFGSVVTDLAIYAGHARPENEQAAETQRSVPLVCIDVIGNDPLSYVQQRCDRYLAEGVAYVWILHPDTKRAYTATKTEGLREFKGDVLRIADPPLELDLKIFG